MPFTTNAPGWLMISARVNETQLFGNASKIIVNRLVSPGAKKYQSG